MGRLDFLICHRIKSAVIVKDTISDEKVENIYHESMCNDIALTNVKSSVIMENNVLR